MERGAEASQEGGAYAQYVLRGLIHESPFLGKLIGYFFAYFDGLQIIFFYVFYTIAAKKAHTAFKVEIKTSEI